LASKQKEIEKLETETLGADFWKDKRKANAVLSRLKSLKSMVSPFLSCKEKLDDLKELAEATEAGEEDFLKELQQDLMTLENNLGNLEFNALLSGEFDANSAILSINAGAGGTESCDWAGMLLRMYNRWAQRKGYSFQITDILPGEEAGIKNATARVTGDYAYGYLKAEKGVHRLVRISPFDANKRRHTSFASVDVIPEVEEDMDIELSPADLKIETFRSSGPGGQHVNVTDSAVRITHIPTGMVVQCQNERSQYKNKSTALRILKARLSQLSRKRKEEEISKEYAHKKRIEWGSQIRSYVMHPYNLVKDHRSDYQTSNVQAVMDGEIDRFIQAYLKRTAGRGTSQDS
jgi:peptide chain release factor 2